MAAPGGDLLQRMYWEDLTILLSKGAALPLFYILVVQRLSLLPIGHLKLCSCQIRGAHYCFSAVSMFCTWYHVYLPG